MSNQFLPFATSGGANALTPAEWAGLTAILANGFQSGVASSEQFNTAFRQALAGTNLLGNFINDQGFNALDDGSTVNLLAAFKNALQKYGRSDPTAARAWVTFNGNTGTVLSSFNVSSITKVATGTYELNFTSNLPNANYAWAGSAGEANGVAVSGSNPGGNNVIAGVGGAAGSTAVRTVSKLRVFCHQHAQSSSPDGLLEDATAICVIVFG